MTAHDDAIPALGADRDGPSTDPAPSAARHDDVSPHLHEDLQRRTVRVLAIGQIISGLGIGAAVSLGALLVAEATGSAAWSGMAATMNTLGAALFAIPLAALAQRRGRRVALSSGALLAAIGALAVTGSAVVASPALLLASLTVMGVGTALNLQARFAATDLAQDSTRGRDLSLVVWSTTIGAVAGPNLVSPSEGLGGLLGLPAFTGGFVIAAIVQLLGAIVYWIALRPDPLLVALGADCRPTARAHGRRVGGFATLRRIPAARRAVVSIALSHAVMVALMGMTPLHLTGHGASLTVVGLTLSLHVAGMYALSPLFGTLTDRLGGRSVVLLGQGMLAAAMLFASLGQHSRLAVTIGLVLLGLGWSAATIAGAAMLSEAVPAEGRTSVQGVSDLLMNLAGALGGASAGVLLSLAGYSGLALGLLATVVVVTAGQLIPRR